VLVKGTFEVSEVVLELSLSALSIFLALLQQLLVQLRELGNLLLVLTHQLFVLLFVLGLGLCKSNLQLLELSSVSYLHLTFLLGCVMLQLGEFSLVPLVPSLLGLRTLCLLLQVGSISVLTLSKEFISPFIEFKLLLTLTSVVFLLILQVTALEVGLVLFVVLHVISIVLGQMVDLTFQVVVLAVDHLEEFLLLGPVFSDILLLVLKLVVKVMSAVLAFVQLSSGIHQVLLHIVEH
jgi:hypothetical protein